MFQLFLLCVLSHTARAFVSPLASASSSTRLYSTASPAVTDYVKDLMEHLNGSRLLESSSDSWRQAIYEAVGAPAGADETAMSKKDNQFALLMTDTFTATFPTEPVDYDDGTCWVECQLRDKKSDELLVDMGVQLQKMDDKYLISKLDWQDFRDEFYPGLSGREWLLAF